MNYISLSSISDHSYRDGLQETHYAFFLFGFAVRMDVKYIHYRFGSVCSREVIDYVISMTILDRLKWYYINEITSLNNPFQYSQVVVFIFLRRYGDVDY